MTGCHRQYTIPHLGLDHCRGKCSIRVLRVLGENDNGSGCSNYPLRIGLDVYGYVAMIWEMDMLRWSFGRDGEQACLTTPYQLPSCLGLGV